ncbi:MAG TPA: histidine phosphatase family protein [Azospirillum sp.]|nr:histidine phosphatase family protein [Azospirillum sp.]
MTTVYLVRHTDHDWVDRGLAGRLPISLNDAGRTQAEALGRWFARRRVDAVWASPLPRTQQTAEPIARHHGLAVRPVDALLEVDFGAWQGKEFTELDRDPAWPRWNAARGRARPPGGETISEVQARMAGFINALGDDDPEGHHVLVGHGDPIRAALAYYLGVAIDLFLRIEVFPGSVSVLAIDGWSPRVLCVNGSIEDGSITAAP